MWHLVVAVLLGNQVIAAWPLPDRYPDQGACYEKALALAKQWDQGNSLHQIGYRCVHEPLEA